MKYLSIDIETTGLDESFCQTLEVGVVLADTSDMVTPVEELPNWSCRFYYDRVIGQPYALWLNAELIKDMDKRDPIHNYMHPDSFWSTFMDWLEAEEVGKLNCSGKNFAGFDLRFLRKLPRWNDEAFHHQVLDPGNFYFLPDDPKLPKTDVCIQRSGIEWDPKRLHRAVEDARMVVMLNRIGLAGLWKDKTLPPVEA